MTTFAKLIVTEEHGIRRFLYPLKVELADRKNESLEISAKDEAGNLLPCEAYRSRSKVIVHFAVSLGPYERKKVTIFRSEQKAALPDPITSEFLEDGSIVSRQERLTITLLPNSDIGSVLYDGAEQLAGPIGFTLNAEQPSSELVAVKSSGRELAFQTASRRVYPSNERICLTTIGLTACKSWAEIVHTIDAPAPGSIISLDIPLTPPSDDTVATCDFGLGNGVYCKIDGDDVLLEADFYGKKPYCCWQISRLVEGIQRIDYQGDAMTVKALAQSLYFHWTLADRSLAVAFTELPATTSHIQALLGRTGKIHISVVLSEMPARSASVGVVLHFLNDIPAKAAATNPASILCRPKVSFKS